MGSYYNYFNTSFMEVMSSVVEQIINEPVLQVVEQIAGHSADVRKGPDPWWLGGGDPWDVAAVPVACALQGVWE